MRSMFLWLVLFGSDRPPSSFEKFSPAAEIVHSSQITKGVLSDIGLVVFPSGRWTRGEEAPESLKCSSHFPSCVFFLAFVAGSQGGPGLGASSIFSI